MMSTCFMSFLAVAVLALLSAVAGVHHGVDITSDAVMSVETIKCLNNGGSDDGVKYRWLNTRMTDAKGDFIPAGLDTVANSRGVMNQNDGLIELCPKKKDTAKMVAETLNKWQNAPDGRNLLNDFQYVFMSVLTGDENCWYTSGSADDVQKNIAHLSEGVKDILGRSKEFGIKTNKQNWTTLTNDWNGLSGGSHPLWWVDQGPASFDDFVPFGGWSSKPALRQYETGATKCNARVNLNAGRDDFICNSVGQSCDDGCCGELPCISNKCFQPCSAMARFLKRC